MTRQHFLDQIVSVYRKFRTVVAVVCVLLALFFAYALCLQNRYFAQFGGSAYDRYGKLMFVYPNARGQLASATSKKVSKLLQVKIVNQEDQQFWYHTGFNPVRWVRGSYSRLTGSHHFAVSTLTEQLVKNLYYNNAERTVWNKFTELLGSVALELCFSKQSIMQMYVNTVPMGKNIVGMETAAWFYFDRPLSQLTDNQLSMLVATIPLPSTKNPFSNQNMTDMQKITLRKNAYTTIQANQFPELTHYCAKRTLCYLSVDRDLTLQLRSFSKSVTENLWEKRGRNAAVVVLDVVHNNVLGIVGSPEPGLNSYGYRLDMSRQARPIGSTVKPFIYTLAFDAGASPETIVSDTEHQLFLGTGYPFYPQNYDGRYRGDVELQTALSNSLNIPSVKTLEFIGAQYFYDWLTKTAQLDLLQTGKSYGLSSALGGLEMTPQSLAYLYTSFAEGGTVIPYTITKTDIWQPVGIHTVEKKFLFSSDSVDKTNAILSNRFLGVDQFGVASSLNLGIEHYAVKTGTSTDYHDSWAVAYTPEIVLVVWIGNAENEPLYNITGQSGAGDLWEIAMNELVYRGYITDIPFSSVPLESELVSKKRQTFTTETVFLFPQNHDVLRIAHGQVIVLRSTQIGDWYVDDKSIGSGKNVSWKPTISKNYTIQHISVDGNVQSMQCRIVFR